MSVPEPPEVKDPTVAGGWTALEPADKRARILEAAIRVFARHGLEAPMHEVAAEAGAGVASIYRIFPSKHDLWAAIVIRRLGELAEAYARAEQRPGDRWSALVELVGNHVRRQSPEPFFLEARAEVEDRPEVAEAVARTAAAEERLLAAARAEGRLRADATGLDLRLLFSATRAARRLGPDAVERALELMLDALDARRGRDG
jgi:AcrR family transcriptional regulator